MAPQKAFSEQMCTSLNDHNVINASGNIISDRVMEALGTIENRLRACEASIKAKDERIEQLQFQSRLKKAENHHDSQMDMIDEMEQHSRRNSVRIHHPGWIENNEAKLRRALVQSNKLRKAFVMSGAVMIETNDGQKITITDIKQLTRYQ